MSRSLLAVGMITLLFAPSSRAQDEMRLRGQISFQMNKATAIVLHPETKYLGAGFTDGSILFFGPQAGKFISVEFAKAHQQAVNAVAFSTDGAWFATASADGTVKIWESYTLDRFQTDCQTRKEGAPLPPVPAAKKTIQVHQFPLTAVAFSPDGKTILAGCKDGSIRAHTISTLKQAALFPPHRGSVNAVAYSPDGKLIASAGADKIVKLAKAEGKPGLTLPIHDGPVLDLSFSPDSKQVATASGIAKKSGIVRIFAVESGKEEATLAKSTDVINTVSFHPKLPRLATGGPDKKLRVWDTETKKEIYADTYAKEIVRAVYSGDGKMLGGISVEEIMWWSGDWEKPTK